MTARKPKPPSTLQVETDKRFITVKDEDMSDALKAFAAKLAESRTPEQVARQIKKMVQFGLYDSEKVVELKDAPAPVEVDEPEAETTDEVEPEATEPEADTSEQAERHLAAV